ncbi:unnamed protein product [Calypogeia fissa]
MWSTKLIEISFALHSGSSRRPLNTWSNPLRVGVVEKKSRESNFRFRSGRVGGWRVSDAEHLGHFSCSRLMSGCRTNNAGRTNDGIDMQFDLLLAISVIRRFSTSNKMEEACCQGIELYIL